MPSPWPVSSSDMEGHIERQEELLVKKGQRAEEASVERQVNTRGRLLQ